MVLSMEDIANEEKKILKLQNAILTKTLTYKNKLKFEINFKPISMKTFTSINSKAIDTLMKDVDLTKEGNKLDTEDILKKLDTNDILDLTDKVLANSLVSSINKKGEPKFFPLKFIQENYTDEFKLTLLKVVMEESGFTENKDINFT